MVRADNGCLEWQGARLASGYGLIGRGRRDEGMAYVHRLAWELAHGPIPDGMFVCHHCDNPPCCNVEHLFLGTHADNMADMVTKGRACGGGRHMTARTHCPSKHPYDEANTYVNPTTGARSCRICRAKSSAECYRARQATAM